MSKLTDRDREADMMKLADAFFENLTRDNCEYGGWGLDDKRPFGNSQVETDILELLDIKPAVSCRNCGDEYSPEQVAYATGLYDSIGDWLPAQWKKMRTQPRSPA